MYDILYAGMVHAMHITSFSYVPVIKDCAPFVLHSPHPGLTYYVAKYVLYNKYIESSSLPKQVLFSILAIWLLSYIIHIAYHGQDICICSCSHV